MRIHHLNCGSLNARLPRAKAIIYCLLIETDKGLTLVDTGFGTGDYEHPSHRMRIFLWLMGVPQLLEETALYQVRSLGFEPTDVSDIVLTHLHLDHAGGLPDFPWARVHLHQSELEAAQHPRRLIELAYDSQHWSHSPQWVLYEGSTRDWYGFEAIHIPMSLKPELLLIPLHGHTQGHCGVAVKTESGWLLHSGDAASAFHPGTDLHDNASSRHCARMLPGRFARRLLGGHIPRLRSLIKDHGAEVQVISSHDVYSLARFRHSEPTKLVRRRSWK
jgi:glyoxylase-like metal-dependent hydrolase (beta-lactamase superfamily II)